MKQVKRKKRGPRVRHLDALWIDMDKWECRCQQHRVARTLLRSSGLKGKWKVTFQAEAFK